MSGVIREGNLIRAHPPVALLAFSRMIIEALLAADSNPAEHIKDYG
jgi:hypothetical protein